MPRLPEKPSKSKARGKRSPRYKQENLLISTLGSKGFEDNEKIPETSGTRREYEHILKCLNGNLPNKNPFNSTVESFKLTRNLESAQRNKKIDFPKEISKKKKAKFSAKLKNRSIVDLNFSKTGTSFNPRRPNTDSFLSSDHLSQVKEKKKKFCAEKFEKSRKKFSAARFMRLQKKQSKEDIVINKISGNLDNILSRNYSRDDSEARNSNNNRSINTPKNEKSENQKNHKNEIKAPNSFI